MLTIDERKLEAKEIQYKFDWQYLLITEGIFASNSHKFISDGKGQILQINGSIPGEFIFRGKSQDNQNWPNSEKCFRKLSNYEISFRC